jgi:PadR family transcriptional regulator, regulatory protein PadR
MDLKEINEIDKKFLKELNAGISALILLSVLSRANEPLYGYQIAKQIEESREEGPIIKLGTLYPVLRSLEDNGLLKSEVEPSVTGPPRRYYQITGFGKKALENWKEIWHDTRKFVDIHVEGGPQ